VADGSAAHTITLVGSRASESDEASRDPSTIRERHVTWHGGRFDAQYDKSRDRAARRAGWQIERITDQALREDFRGEIAAVVEMYRARADERATRSA